MWRSHAKNAAPPIQGILIVRSVIIISDLLQWVAIGLALWLHAGARSARRRDIERRARE